MLHYVSGDILRSRAKAIAHGWRRTTTWIPAWHWSCVSAGQRIVRKNKERKKKIANTAMIVSSRGG